MKLWYNEAMQTQKSIMTKQEILSALRRLKPTLQERFRVRSIALVGSYARNEANPDSDIDIVVDMPSSLERVFGLQYFLEEKLGKRVDIALKKNIRAFIRKHMEKDKIDV
jgi:predicted nucleotidyltransferase